MGNLPSCDSQMLGFQSWTTYHVTFSDGGSPLFISIIFFTCITEVESLVQSIFKNEIWCRVQQLRALAALPDDLGSARSTLIVTHVSVSTVPGILVTSSGLFQHLAHTWCTDIHADKTPMHTEINKN